MAERSASRSAIAVETRPVGPVVAGGTGAAGTAGTTAVDAVAGRPDRRSGLSDALGRLADAFGTAPVVVFDTPPVGVFGTPPVGVFDTAPVVAAAGRRAGGAAFDGGRGRGG